MSLNAAALKLLAAKGLTTDDIIALAEVLESGSPRTSGAERQARYRKRKKAATVTNDVTSDVTKSVTSDVTSPPKEIISNPPSVSDETELAARPKNNRGARLADDFEPPDDWIAWAMKRRGWSRDDAVEECECFARYWQAKPGREACKRDWPKTWQNWAINSRRGSHPHQQAPPKFSEVMREERERKERGMGGKQFASGGQC